MRVLPMALVGAVLLLSIWSPVSAHPSVRQVSNDDDFGDQPRTVQVEPEEDRFEIRSFGVGEDEIRVRFRADDGELRLEFRDVNGTLEVELQLTFDALWEYVPEVVGAPLGVGDEVVQRIEWNDLVFNPVTWEEVEDGYVLRVEYSLPETDFSLALTFWVFQTGGEVEGVPIRPSEVKFDVEVSLFPFERSDSALALLLTLETEVEPKMNLTGTQGELDAVGERYEGFFRWAANVTADGVQAQVGSTILALETESNTEGGGEFEVERTVVLSYPRADSLVHDPVVGISQVPLLPPPSNGGGPEPPVATFQRLAYFLMIGVAALFVVGTLLVRRVRRS